METTITFSDQIRDRIARIAEEHKRIWSYGVVSYETNDSRQQYLVQPILRKLGGELSDYINHIRNVLDHVAYQIATENKLTIKKKDILFPIYCKDRKSFDEFMDKHFPGLKNKNYKLYLSIESIQYYNDNSWLKDLMEMANLVKHRMDEQLGYIDKKLICIGNINTTQILDYDLHITKNATLSPGSPNRGMVVAKIIIDEGSTMKTNYNVYRGPKIITVKDVESLSDPQLNTYDVKLLYLKHSDRDFLPIMQSIRSGFTGLISILQTN